MHLSWSKRLGSRWLCLLWWEYPPYHWPFVRMFRETWRRSGRASYHLYVCPWMLELKPLEPEEWGV